MLPPPPGAINPHLSTFQGNGLSFGSTIAPWAAGWVGPDSTDYLNPSSSMMGVAALYGGAMPGVNPAASEEANNGSFNPVGAGPAPSQATINALNDMRATTLSGVTVNAFAQSPSSGSVFNAPLPSFGSSDAGIDGSTVGLSNNFHPTNLGGVTVNANAPLQQPMGMIGNPILGAGSGAGAVDLPPVNVQANKPTISGLNDLLNSSGGGVQLPGVDVTTLPAVHVTATPPTGLIGTLANFKSAHPLLYQLGNIGLNLATGGATALPGMVVNAMVDHANGKSWLGSLLPTLPNLGSLQSGSSGPASYQDASDALTSLLGTPPWITGAANGGGGSSSSAPGGSIATSGPLPDYAGLASLAGYGNAPIGGYWNQQALKMAAPAYGPYAGFGGTSPQPTSYANPYAPSGIMTAGY